MERSVGKVDENDYEEFLEAVDSAVSKEELRETLIDWRDYLSEKYGDTSEDEDGGVQYTLR